MGYDVMAQETGSNRTLAEYGVETDGGRLSGVDEVETVPMDQTSDTLALIPCSKSKQDGELPAREKYAAPRAQLFTKARDYVEVVGMDYVVLSGKYGALAPEEVIDDYDVSVRDRETAAWRKDVLARLDALSVDLYEYEEIVVLAPSDYYEPLVDILEQTAAQVSYPVADCGGYGYIIGRLADWLDALNEGAERPDHGVTNGGA